MESQDDGKPSDSIEGQALNDLPKCRSNGASFVLCYVVINSRSLPEDISDEALMRAQMQMAAVKRVLTVITSSNDIRSRGKDYSCTQILKNALPTLGDLLKVRNTIHFTVLERNWHHQRAKEMRELREELLHRTAGSKSAAKVLRRSFGSI